MWVFTNFGIFMPSVRPADTVPVGDTRLLQIRARRRKDLDELRSRHMPELGATVYMPHTDYQFRAYCTHDEWGQALASMAQMIDYTKFKPTAIDRQLHDTLMDVWYALYDRLGGWGRFGRQQSYRPTDPAKVVGSRVSGGYPWERAEEPDVPLFSTAMDLAEVADADDLYGPEHWASLIAEADAKPPRGRRGRRGRRRK